MLNLIYGVVLLLNLIVSHKQKKSNSVLILTVAFIMILWVGNNDGPDIYNYINNYTIAKHGLISGTNQFLYYWSLRFFNQLGFTFFFFFFVINIIGISIILFTLQSISTNIHLVLVLYLLHLVFLDGIQIRNFAAVPFLLMGLLCLLKQIKHWRILFVLFIVIASQFHVSFLVYLVFLLLPTWNYTRSRMLKIHGLVGIVLTVSIFRFRSHLSSIVAALNVIDTGRAINYSSASTNMGALIPITLQLFGVFITWYVYKRMERTSFVYTEEPELVRDMGVCKYIYWLNLLACYLLPFSIIQLTFYRLVRNILLINYASIGIGKKYFKGTNLTVLTIFYLGSWMIAEFVLLNTFDNIVFPFFQSNMLFD